MVATATVPSYATVIAEEAAAERAVAAVAAALAPFTVEVRDRVIARALIRLQGPAEPTAAPDARKVPAGRLRKLRGGSHKDRILAFLATHPGAEVSEIATAVYGSDKQVDCSRTRSLLHQMKREERVSVTTRGSVGHWTVVDPRTRLASTTAQVIATEGGAAV